MCLEGIGSFDSKLDISTLTELAVYQEKQVMKQLIIFEIWVEWLLLYGENIETCSYVGGGKKAGGIENGYSCISGSNPALHGKHAKFQLILECQR